MIESFTSSGCGGRWEHVLWSWFMRSERPGSATQQLIQADKTKNNNTNTNWRPIFLDGLKHFTPRSVLSRMLMLLLSQLQLQMPPLIVNVFVLKFLTEFSFDDVTLSSPDIFERLTKRCCTLRTMTRLRRRFKIIRALVRVQLLSRNDRSFNMIQNFNIVVRWLHILK